MYVLTITIYDKTGLHTHRRDYNTLEDISTVVHYMQFFLNPGDALAYTILNKNGDMLARHEYGLNDEVKAA